MPPKILTIDGKKYELDALSKPAKQLVVNLQLADAEIKRLRMQLALAQTARNAYAQTLKVALGKVA